MCDIERQKRLERRHRNRGGEASVTEWLSNPAARGATVTAPWGRYQIVHTRCEPDIHIVWYRNGQWDTRWTKIVDPERFGPIPDSDKSFRAWVENWLDGNR